MKNSWSQVLSSYYWMQFFRFFRSTSTQTYVHIYIYFVYFIHLPPQTCHSRRRDVKNQLCLHVPVNLYEDAGSIHWSGAMLLLLTPTHTPPLPCTGAPSPHPFTCKNPTSYAPGYLSCPVLQGKNVYMVQAMFLMVSAVALPAVHIAEETACRWLGAWVMGGSWAGRGRLQRQI